MGDVHTLDKTELVELYSRLEEKYGEFKNKNLSLDMSRGKPSPDQLDLSSGLFDILNTRTMEVVDHIDIRNYGGVDGIQEAKDLFAEILHVRPTEVIVGGNSSLTIMYDTISRALLKGVIDSDSPWGKLPKVKFLCPSPGYDRHFAICESLNIEMITIDMLDDGPDMNKIEELVSKDDTIKGIWCVPKYSNPEGIIYSDEVVNRFATMETKAKDFKIFWDDAYTVHHLTNEQPHLKSILQACKEAGHPNRVFIFASTSKITFPGSGVAAMAASEENIQFILEQLSAQTIGPDKINQLRHVRFLKNLDHINEHMKKHAELIKPKFDLVLRELDSQLRDKNIASWSKPKGGYFISLNTLDGCAAEVVKRAAEVGVKLTKAGATFPYGKDPRDRNIRIAPTYPSIAELKVAIDVLCLCVQMVSIKKLLNV
ncbi:aminotransferase class I/II-fold pyridoxal phosphate-dependent enzyme [Sporolactobacillus laevolacticus]|uniref:aminotransferase class I/II-fold pyridoxal phosphate-dependent enzyme n=1 Tax=Sporolactobacillus laevolacticus TaxID=33018 RepID=UPI0025B5606A|nr:aminotransferase class I/II-fold pyridoxal phosphate-dependent enzyme [Sporolactobacillus laevolacticus]MDN3953767.1 aminotransferase class I/II-fold pyridoxal phosphate-dependent enzyme [Sporolactobacillus laevolacticus]